MKCSMFFWFECGNKFLSHKKFPHSFQSTIELETDKISSFIVVIEVIVVSIEKLLDGAD